MLGVIVPVLSAIAIVAASFSAAAQDVPLASQQPVTGDPPDPALLSSPAPVPDLTVEAPLPSTETGLRVAPTFLPLRDPNASAGYLPGSSLEEVEQQDEHPTAALDLQTPLE
jgi:hypothetical protein